MQWLCPKVELYTANILKLRKRKSYIDIGDKMNNGNEKTHKKSSCQLFDSEGHIICLLLTIERLVWHSVYYYFKRRIVNTTFKISIKSGLIIRSV